MSWFVLEVKNNTEDKVQETLNKIGIEAFNPTVTGVKYWGERRKTVRTPLFKSYIFIRIEERYKRLVFGISDVKGYLFSKGKPVSLPNEEINAIKDLLSKDNYGLLMLSKLIETKEIDIENWFSENSSGTKWIGKSYTAQLMDNMDVILKNKLRDVV